MADQFLPAEDKPARLDAGMGHLEAAIKIFEEKTDCDFLLNKARLSHWVHKHSKEPRATRHNDPTQRQWAISRDILGAAYACAKAEPYAWSAIRNGLAVASLLGRGWEEHNKAMFALLVEADPNFADLSYVPPNELCLKSDPDFTFFIQNFAHLDKPMKEVVPAKARTKSKKHRKVLKVLKQ